MGARGEISSLLVSVFSINFRSLYGGRLREGIIYAREKHVFCFYNSYNLASDKFSTLVELESDNVG